MCLILALKLTNAQTKTVFCHGGQNSMTINKPQADNFHVETSLSYGGGRATRRFPNRARIARGVRERFTCQPAVAGISYCHSMFGVPHFGQRGACLSEFGRRVV